MKGIIERIDNEATDILGFTIRLDETLNYLPGQFIMVSFADDPATKKPFSIVSHVGNSIRIIVKKNGLFTQRLFSSAPGQEVTVTGPYGRFTLPQEEKSLILIAGGVGITPLFNIFQHINKSQYGKRAKLYYSGKSKEDMALYSEILDLDSEKTQVHYFFTGTGSRINAEALVEDAEEESLFYICGPGSMIESLRKGLVAKGIEEDRIKTEQF